MASQKIDPFQQARMLLPIMPEEIFQLWFDDRIRANGWPPDTLTWAGALREKPLSFWQNLCWNKEIIKLDYDLLTENTNDIVNGLIDANIKGISNEYSAYIPDSIQRMMNIFKYVTENHTLPSTLIFFEDENRLELVDGSHRIAVFFFLKRLNVGDDKLSPLQSVWIGRIAQISG